MRVRTFQEMYDQYMQTRKANPSYPNSLAEDIYSELVSVIGDLADYVQRVETNVRALQGELKLIRENWRDSMKSSQEFHLRLTMQIAEHWNPESNLTFVDTEEGLRILLDELETLRKGSR